MTEIKEERGLYLDASQKKPDTRLVLASLSPRRKELLAKLGLSFDAIPSHADESFDPTWAPENIVLDLAEKKARAVSGMALKKKGEGLAIIAADTIVVLDGEVLNKPEDDREAMAMLTKLSGREHDVFTGVVVLFSGVEEDEFTVYRQFEKTVVTMRPIGEAEMKAYVASGEPSDKAGAYAIQGIASAFVARIDGCFSNVVGLPVPTAVAMLRQVGIEILGA